MSRSDGTGADRGSATILSVAVILAVVVAGLVVADIGILLRTRLEVAAAADAAALAAAPLTFTGDGSEPAVEAGRFASANGATLVSCECAVDPTWQPRIVRVIVAGSAATLLAGSVDLTVSSTAEYVPTALFADPG